MWPLLAHSIASIYSLLYDFINLSFLLYLSLNQTEVRALKY